MPDHGEALKKKMWANARERTKRARARRAKIDDAELDRLRDCAGAWAMVARTLLDLRLPPPQRYESTTAWAERTIRELAQRAGRERRTEPSF